MRPRLSALGFLSFLIAAAAVPPAHAQNTVLGTWSTDRECSARALRVTFGDGLLTIERNGHRIYRGAAAVVATDDAVAVRLVRGGAPPDDPRNVIRFGRDGGAIRMIAATSADGTVQYARVPPLYLCRATAADAAPPVLLQSSATTAPAR